MLNFARILAILYFSASALSAADLTGIWMGEVTGPKGEKQDMAFQFQAAKGEIKGVLFGDEFDLPVQDLKIDGDRVTFSVSSMNYYGGRRVKTLYTGILTDKTLELTRQQADPPPAAKADKPKEPRAARAPIILKRLTS
jgi:hypothetical protein